jgi:putative glycosyltransferase (TIGR04372 family)
MPKWLLIPRQSLKLPGEAVGHPPLRPEHDSLAAASQVIDYCHSPIRADWMDVFLLARCRFLIGTNSGPAFATALCGTPAVLTNWCPAAERPWHSSDIFVPKLLRTLSDGKYLTLSETLSGAMGQSHSLRYHTDRGIGVEDNNSEMIRAAVEEILAQSDRTSQPNAEEAKLRLQAD